jgi:sigma-B regulation protein RsbU (phosphoserine phosphatase)
MTVGEKAALEGFYDALLEDDPEKLYDRAPCGYLSTTPDGRIIKVNQTFLTWTGHSRESLVHRARFVDLLTGGGRIYHETHYAPMLRMQDSVREIALDIRRADGRLLPVLVNATLERDAAGAPRVVRIALFDATERREYERELLREKKRAEESEARASALARTLQGTLIPPSPPDIPGLDVAAVYRPAGDGAEVGGDFYDVFQVAHDDWVIVLGDVCGKGIDAAVVTALARYTVRAVAVRVSSANEVLRTLNDVLLGHETDRFCTAALLRLRKRADGWSVTMASGGHPLPLLLTPGGTPRPVGENGPLIGVLEDPEFPDHTLLLEPGSTLVLYTDGVTEARRRREFFGEGRLHVSVVAHGASAPALVEGLLAEVLEFQHDRPRDDVAVVALRVPDGSDDVPLLTASPEAGGR